MSNGTFYIKRGDTLPSFAVSDLKYADGSAVSFVSGDSAVFNMKDVNGNSIVDRGNVTLEEGTGNAVYAWQANDTDEAGTFFAEIEVTFNSGGIATWPNLGHWYIQIGTDLG